MKLLRARMGKQFDVLPKVARVIYVLVAGKVRIFFRRHVPTVACVSVELAVSSPTAFRSISSSSEQRFAASNNLLELGERATIAGPWEANIPSRGGVKFPGKARVAARRDVVETDTAIFSSRFPAACRGSPR